MTVNEEVKQQEAQGQQEGQQRHPTDVPAATKYGPVNFELQAAKFGKNSKLLIEGEEQKWVSKVTVEVPAKGLTTMTLSGVWIQGHSQGEALVKTVVNVLTFKDRVLFTQGVSDTEALLKVIEGRTSQPNSNRLQGSLLIDTEEGPRLATFIMVLSEPMLPPEEAVKWLQDQEAKRQPKRADQADLNAFAAEIRKGSL